MWLGKVWRIKFGYFYGHHVFILSQPDRYGWMSCLMARDDKIRVRRCNFRELGLCRWNWETNTLD